MTILDVSFNQLTNHPPPMGYKMSNMTLDEAIEHCKKVAKEQENCNVGCSLEHRQLAIWLSALKAITENNYLKPLFNENS